MSTLSSRTEPPPRAMEQEFLRSGPDLFWRRVRIIVGATLAMALGFGSLALTSVFIRPLEAEFAWTRAEVSLGYAAGTIGMAVGGYVWGRVTDRVDVRTLMAIGGTGMFLSLLSMTAVQSLWQFYFANLVLGGLGFAVLYTPLLAATGEWFDRQRGLAIGIVTAGGALGQGVLPFIASHLTIAWAGASPFLAWQSPHYWRSD